MQIKTAYVVLASLTAASAVGCGTSGGPANDSSKTAVVRASLHRAKSCPDLLTDLKGDAAYKVNKGINRQIEAIQACVAKYGDERCAMYGDSYGASTAGGGTPERAATNGASAAPTAPSASGSGDAKASGSASSFSQTNTQVKGVDEADIVKNDGKNLYVIHGRSFKVVNAWPANTLAEVGSIDIDGQPSEMYVADGKVVIYSQVNGTAIFAAAGKTPKTTYRDFGYGFAVPGMASGSARTDDASVPSPGSGGGGGGGGQPYAPLTKVTVLTLNGTTPSVTREFYFEGNYLDSRRVGSNVRSVFQGYAYGPKLKYGIYDLYAQDTSATKEGVAPTQPQPRTPTIKLLEQLRSENLASINASQLADWLPYSFTKEGGAVKAELPACEDFYVPNAGSTQSGITQVASLDLADPTARPRQSAILGQADTVYGSADTLYLAARAWVEPPFYWNDPYIGVGSDGTASSPPVASDSPPPAPAPSNPGTRSIGLRTTPPVQDPSVVTWSQSDTHIHKFEFSSDAKFPNYVASGTVTGYVKNQFALDDKDGNLRIATTEQRSYVSRDGQYIQTDATTRPNTLNHVYVLGASGPFLDVKGDAGELAPNEQIYSVRFVGNRGYVVTFRQVDPLFVIDLADPTKPNVLAALKIPGFSEYMHPIDENHLLTIGRDATDTGRAQGLQLQIFDVTDGRNPILAHKFTYTGEEYGSSDAEYDHKAFTFFAEKGMLAFPYYAYNANTPNGMRSTLELFKVDVASGFTKLGSVDNSDLGKTRPTGYCGGYYGPSVRRGVFLESFVYSISYGGIVVKDTRNLATQVSSLSLPSPTVDTTYGASPMRCE